MRDSIREFFNNQMGLGPHGDGGAVARADDLDQRNAIAEGEATHRLHVAACALLLELAHADDEFSSVERAHIEAVIRRHFDLDEETAGQIIALAQAERADAVDLYQFTSLVRENYDLGQKTLLAEIMWGVILTDGQIARDEAHMLRKIANLLDLKPGYLAQARKRANG